MSPPGGAKKTVCPSCGGDIVVTEAAVLRGKREQRIPMGACLSCGARYDRGTAVYYRLFADRHLPGAGTSLLSLGMTGEVDGEPCKIAGGIRFLHEDESAGGPRDEWHVRFNDGSSVWVEEEKGRFYYCTEYSPENINLHYSADRFEFEGGTISKRHESRLRIAGAEGDLSYTAAVGDAVTLFRFRNEGAHFRVFETNGKTFVRRAEPMDTAGLLFFFDFEEFRDEVDAHFRKKKHYRYRAVWYALMMVLMLGFSAWLRFTERTIPIPAAPVQVLADGEKYLDSGVRFSQIIYGPVTLGKPGSVFRLLIENPDMVQRPHNEWVSLRVMLIQRGALRKLPVKRMSYAYLKIKERLSEIDVLNPPLEDYAFKTGFWHCSENTRKGQWQLQKGKSTHGFILEKSGDYYFYVEVYGPERHGPGSFSISLRESAGNARCPLAAAAFFIILSVINYRRAMGSSVFEAAVRMKEEG